MRWGRSVSKALQSMQLKRAGLQPLTSKRGARKKERAEERRQAEIRQLELELRELDRLRS